VATLLGTVLSAIVEAITATPIANGFPGPFILHQSLMITRTQITFEHVFGGWAKKLSNSSAVNRKHLYPYIFSTLYFINYPQMCNALLTHAAEERVIGELCSLLGYDNGSGVFTAGGSVSSLQVCVLVFVSIRVCTCARRLRQLQRETRVECRVRMYVYVLACHQICETRSTSVGCLPFFMVAHFCCS
jgi:hypothetical protein